MNQQHDFIEDSNRSNNTHFNEILNARMDRRSILRGGAGLTAAMMLGSGGLLGCSDNDDDSTTSSTSPSNPDTIPTKINFQPVAHSKQDIVLVPEEYQVQAFLPVGQPLFSGMTDWSDSETRSGESYEYRIGDNHDGLWFFGMQNGQLDESASTSGLLAINHEYVESERLNPLGFYTRTIEDEQRQIYKQQRLSQDVRREINCHGVSIVEVKRAIGGQFELVKDSKFNRRITSATLVDIAGPAAGNDLLKTKYDPSGTTTRGINNQCGSGRSPWGTYLTVEENFLNVFARSEDSTPIPEALDAAFKRYGLPENGTGASYLWHTPAKDEEAYLDEFARWDVGAIATSAVEDYRNAYHTFGYIVEIDPFAPDSRPVKRSALGRYAHENCGYAPVQEGQPIVLYMGDDSRGEYVYKFVSNALWSNADAKGGLAAGDKYLNNGTLYVAKFNADGRGQWIALTYGENGLDSTNTFYPFSSQADVCIFTRLAADAVAATPMDRPEWVNTSPITGEVYLTLTNSNASNRGNKQPVDAANPRNYDNNADGKLDGNPNGHVIRWRADNDNHASVGFQWDIFAFGAPYDLTEANLSGLTAENDFSSPDGLMFDSRGVLWLETDDGAYLNRTNCMLLVALPGTVGDGSSQKVGDVTTYIGAQPTTQNFARFLVGPLEAEITGVTFTPDLKTLFISIQHPGEKGNRNSGFNSHWPDSQTNVNSTALPRSALAVITRKDGKVLLADN